MCRLRGQVLDDALVSALGPRFDFAPRVAVFAESCCHCGGDDVAMRETHPMAQALRGRRRGRLLKPSSPQQASCLLSTRVTAKSKQGGVVRRCLGNAPDMACRWATLLTRYKVGKPLRAGRRLLRNGRVQLTASMLSQAKARKKRGFDIFLAQSFPAQRNDVGTLAKRQRLNATWNAMSQAEKQVYQAAADALNDVGDRRSSLPQFLSQHIAGESEPSGRRRTNVRVADLQSYHDVWNDPAWQSGSRLESFGTALRPELVLPLAQPVAKARVAQRFSYDAIAKPPSAIALALGDTQGAQCWTV